MLQPARRKFRKEQKGRNTGIATRGNSVAFGDFGLKCTDRGRLTARQLEAARRAISRHVKRGGRIWIRVFPDKPISTKPAGLSLPSPPKCVWVTVKVTPSTTWLKSSPARLCLRSSACPKNSHAKPSVWPLQSCPCAPHSCRARLASNFRRN